MLRKNQPFVYSGKRKLMLQPSFGRVTFLYAPQAGLPRPNVSEIVERLLKTQQRDFAGKKVGVAVPDYTRDIHIRTFIYPLAQALSAVGAKPEYIIALGLHRPLEPRALKQWLGAEFVKTHRVIQHNPKSCVRLGLAGHVPVELNRRLQQYDTILTLGVVEPHLYAGFSGGVKSLAVGLGGERSILHTHAVAYLTQPGIQIGKLRGNPFQQWLWEVHDLLPQPVFSLNLVNDLHKQLACLTAGTARSSFQRAVKQARVMYAQPVPKPFDVVLVGCDAPKDQSLYQTSRLFNYMLEKKRLVKKGGAIIVFSRACGSTPSPAEKNFQRALAAAPSQRSDFSLPGEHRAFKVFQAAQYAQLGLVGHGARNEKLGPILRWPNSGRVMAWINKIYGPSARIGIIPLGFSFIPVRVSRRARTIN